ncbi:homing endonuclease associated repeat-containing protein, partial [Halobacterium salinarum]|nr:hypothetical protein [Halobacterium salinarum]
FFDWDTKSTASPNLSSQPTPKSGKKNEGGEEDEDDEQPGTDTDDGDDEQPGTDIGDGDDEQPEPDTDDEDRDKSSSNTDDESDTQSKSESDSPDRLDLLLEMLEIKREIEGLPTKEDIRTDASYTIEEYVNEFGSWEAAVDTWRD